MLPSSSTAPYVSSNMRYVGARLASGFGDVALAAEVMGLPLEEYQGYEEIFGAQLETARLVARTFGVSMDYLIGSRAVSHREELADIIALGLAHHKASLPIVKSSAWETRKLATALIAMRESSGFDTPAVAAQAMGWSALLYTAHEEAARPLTAAQLALYALQYQLRPDAALRGEPPVRLWEDIEYPWWRLQTREEHVGTTGLVSPHFDWLATGASASAHLNLPLVEFVNGSWEVGEETFPMSRKLLPSAVGFVGDTLYGLVDRVNEEVHIIVVDPTRTGVDSMNVTLSGDIRIDAEPSRTVVDPTHHRPKDNETFFGVGAFVLEISTRSLLS
jgi:hypothetical protein